MALLALLCASSGGEPAPASTSTPEAKAEYKIKAALLYNFIRYTTWPDDAFRDDEAPIELLVVGANPFGDVLPATFKGKELHERRVEVQTATKLPPNAKPHLVFCALSKAEDRKELLRHYDKQPTLVMGEADGFAEQGATGNFYIADKKVRFEVNTGAAKRSRLVIGAGLLKLAKIVKTKEGH